MNGSTRRKATLHHHAGSPARRSFGSTVARVALVMLVPLASACLEDPRLETAENCDELLSSIQNDAILKVAWQADDIRRGDRRVFFSAPAPLVADSAIEEGAPAPDDFSDTNTQVEGVDEADFVETDGSRIYLLHQGELLILSAWPPSASTITSRTEIEGHPIEMFVADGRALVFSSTFLDESGVSEFSCGPVPLPGIAVDALIAPCGRTMTKLTLLDVTGASVSTLREEYVDGHYLAARRHGSIVRAVIQGFVGVPALPSPLEFGATEGTNATAVTAWTEAATGQIQETTLGDWISPRMERADGELRSVGTSCGRALVARPGNADYGLTRIVGIDMAAPDRGSAETLVVGRATHLYANAEHLVLAEPSFGWFQRGQTEDKTAVHLFSLTEGDLGVTYLASGFIPGQIRDQFALDESGGVIRASTTITRYPEAPRDADFFVPPTTWNQMLTLGVADEETLRVIGTTGDLAEDERVFSTRYIGDIGYMVTFRQVDPLFVVDLSNPAAPTVLGELKIPGFSEYMHPLGDGHLLTIGQDADEETGRVRGLALQIFDVTDPTNPTLAHRHLLGTNTNSAASYDHRNFTYYASRQTLAIPVVNYAPFQSALRLFSIDTGQGIEPSGMIDHTPVFADAGCNSGPEWGCGYGDDVRRGLFIDDYIYSISWAGMLVHELDALDTTIATVPFD